MASPGGSDGAMTQGLEGMQLSNSSTRDVTMTCKLENAKSLTMRELQEITGNFSMARQIGQGTYGKVFKGALDNGEEIAVKLLHNNMVEPNDEQFRQEFENLMRLKHPNIVRFVGYCYETQHKPLQFAGETFFAEQISKALCFEYMPNGSLEKHLSEEFDGLDWHARYKIIKGTCEGLKYLHEGFKEPMYHLDLKPDNILLDDNMEAKLADFGLSRLFGGQQTMSTQSTFGTIGYMPPEYLFGHVVSKKFDIFSLGVVMTKIIAGPRGHTRAAEMPRQEFLDQVRENWRSRLQATWSSPRLLKAHSEQVNICTEIALSCMEMDRHKRPSIEDIIHQLNDSEVVIDEALSLSASWHSWMREDLVKLKAFTRSEVIPGGETCNEFPILVRVTAPPWCVTPHVGVDAVAVVDLRGHSLGGVGVQDALKILINKLGRHDRLAMVSTVCHTRLTELTYMSDHGRDIARLKILGLEDIARSVDRSRKTMDIVASLREGAKILQGREMGKSRAGCIMFLTNREDLWVRLEIVPDHTFEFPVHILGMGHLFYGEGAYHPKLLKAIAHMFCGTFSFFDSQAEVEEAFEMFISCLRKVAATSIKITLVAQEGVTISSIESGGYQHHVSSDKQCGEIDMNNIYAGVQKNFIVYLTVGESNEKLLTIGGRFQSRNNENRQLADMAVFVLRPRSACSPEKLSMHREVAAELTRTQLVKGISAMIESQKDWEYICLTGEDFEALWETVRTSEEAHSAPEKTLLDLGKDIEEMTKFTANGPYKYWNTSGMAYVLSWLSSHEWQRATAKGSFYETGAFALGQSSVLGQHADHADINDG